MRLWWLLAGMIPLAACSAGADGDDDDDDDGVGASSSTGGGTSVGGAAPGGHTPTGGGGSSAGGGGTGDATLFPLEVGYEWTYTVQAVGTGAVCSPGQHTATVIGTQQVAGRTAFEVTNWCTGAPGTNLYAVGEGDEVLLHYQGQWLTVIDPLLQEGHTWDYFNTSFTWHQEPPVTVPAGTFDDCWTAQQNVSYTAFTTYCRGAGAVRSYSADLNGAGWDAQLTAKSF